MQVKVIREFYDKEAGMVLRHVDEPIDVTEERAKALADLGLAAAPETHGKTAKDPEISENPQTGKDKPDKKSEKPKK